MKKIALKNSREFEHKNTAPSKTLSSFVCFLKGFRESLFLMFCIMLVILFLLSARYEMGILPLGPMLTEPLYSCAAPGGPGW